MPNTSMHALRAAAFALLALTACQAAPPPPPVPAPSAPAYTDGAQVVNAMHARYDGKWYRTLTFTQKTSRLQPDGTWSVQTWYEAMHLPGRLRIDFDPVSGGNGVLYARDSQYVANGGRIVRSDPGINDLLLLGFDVYGNPPARTVALLRRQGFDLSRVHQTIFEGRPTIVVGAYAGDQQRKQFWVDADRLYFVRLLEADRRDSTRVQDIRFASYAPFGGGWVAPRVEIWNGGKLVFTEDYTDIRTNVPLDDAIFDPQRWKTAKHWLGQ